MSEHPKNSRKSRVIVAAVLVVALLAFALAAALLLRGGRGGQVPASGGENSAEEAGASSQAAPPQPQPAPAGALPETEDAGQAYVDGTVFLGDSNTRNFVEYELLSEAQVMATPSVGIDAVLDDALPEALAKAPPQRVLMIYGTNDVAGYEPEEFAERYRAAVEAIRAAVPDTVVIVGAVPPIGPNPAYEKHLARMPAMNEALMAMCGEMDIPFLDSWGALTDENGALRGEYCGADNFHLSEAGLAALLQYYRTHAVM